MNDKELKRSVLIVGIIAAFITPFLASSVNLALPTIGADLKIDAILLNWIPSSYLLAAAVFLLPLGRLSDIVGRVRIFKAGIVLFTISTTLIIFSGNIYQLLVLRVAQGASSAMIFGTSLAIVSSVFGPGERGKAIGYTITSVYTGLATGPVIGGILTQYFGWRSVFAFLIPICLLALYLVFSKIKVEWKEAEHEKFDLSGAIVWALALVALMTGLSQLPQTKAFFFLGAFAVLSVLFVAMQMRKSLPLLDIGLLINNRVFAFSNLAALIHYSATTATGFMMSLYLQYVKGLAPREAGFILIASPVTMALFSPLAGKLSDKYNSGIIASSGMAVTSVGLIMLCFVTASTSLVAIFSVLLAMGVGFAMFSTPNTNAIMSSVEKKNLGTASGMVGTMRMIGQMTSMGISMMLFALLIGRVKLSPETNDGLLAAMRIGFIIFSFLCIGAIFASLARNKAIREQNNRK